MVYELKKISSSRMLLLLFLLLLIINALTFIAHCHDDSAGFTMRQVQNRYSSTDNLNSDIELDYAVLERKNYVNNYKQDLEKRITEAELKIRIGFFGSSDGFQIKALENAVKDYTELRNIIISEEFSGGDRSPS